MVSNIPTMAFNFLLILMNTLCPNKSASKVLNSMGWEPYRKLYLHFTYSKPRDGRVLEKNHCLSFAQER